MQDRLETATAHDLVDLVGRVIGCLIHRHGSNPGNLNGFKTKWMKERLDTIKFLDVTTSMLPYGVPFPALPETPEIMNVIVPDMLQNALTGAMTVDQAADDAANKVDEIMSGGGL